MSSTAEHDKAKIKELVRQIADGNRLFRQTYKECLISNTRARELEYDLEQANIKTQSCDFKISDLESQVDQHAKEAARYRNRYQDGSKTITRVQHELHHANDKIAEQGATLADLEAKIESMAMELKLKDITIEEQRLALEYRMSIIQNTTL